MSVWAALESPLAEELLCHIDPRDKDASPEDDRQGAFVSRVKKQAPHLTVVAILNGERRGQWALNLARKLGAAWGFPDVMVLGAGRVCFLEFKNGTDSPPQHQIDRLNWLWRNSFPVGVFRRPDTAWQFLCERGFAT